MPPALANKINAGSFRGAPSPHDAVCLVKKYISDSALAQDPLLVMTYGRALNFTLVTNEKTLDSNNSNTVFSVYVAYIYIHIYTYIYITYILKKYRYLSKFLNIYTRPSLWWKNHSSFRLLLLQKLAANWFHFLHAALKSLGGQTIIQKKWHRSGEV